MEKRKFKLKLGEILSQITKLSPQQIEEALDCQVVEKQSFGKPLGEILIDKGYVAKEDVETALAIQYGFPYLLVLNYTVQEDALKIVSKKIALKYNLIPLEKMADVLVIAIASPFNQKAMDEIQQQSGYKTRFFLSSDREIKEAIRKYYG